MRKPNNMLSARIISADGTAARKKNRIENLDPLTVLL